MLLRTIYHFYLRKHAKYWPYNQGQASETMYYDRLTAANKIATRLYKLYFPEEPSVPHSKGARFARYVQNVPAGCAAIRDDIKRAKSG